MQMGYIYPQPFKLILIILRSKLLFYNSIITFETLREGNLSFSFSRY